MAPHSSTLAWKIPWTEEPGKPTERLHFHFSLSCFGEGNGNPLQCSCLENPRDGGAWWAAVYGIAQSRPRLKWLSSSRPNYLMCSKIVIKLRQCIIKIKSHVMSIVRVQSVAPVHFRVVRCHQMKKRHHI